MLLSELAAHLGLEFHGNDLEVRGVNTLESAGPDQISFFANPKYRSQLAKTRAGAVIIAPADAKAVRNPLLSSSPYLDFVRIVQLFSRPQDEFQGQSALAYIAQSAHLDSSVCVHPHAYIAEGVLIGKGSRIFPGVYIGENCQIGKNCLIYPNVSLMADTVVGNNVILHPGVVIGSDGFGFAASDKGSVKFPQVGKVIIGDDVEIGANTTIDRAALGETRIETGCKIDNLVQIGHNVQVGEQSILVAQVGIAGSSSIGKNVILGGQVGVSGHLKIEDGVRVGAKSGVTHSLPVEGVVSGIPAISHQNWLKSAVLFSRLPELFRQIRALEKEVERLANAVDD